MDKNFQKSGIIEVYENDIVKYAKLYMEEHDVDDMRKASQSIWNACLRYVQKKVFPDRQVLKSKHLFDNGSVTLTTCGAYNYELLMDICDIYIDLCFDYEKEISVMGYSMLTGIDYNVIWDWGKTRGLSSPTAGELLEKLTKLNEESLSDKLSTGIKNPVGVIAILNRRHGWASPYTSDSRQQISKGADELPQLKSSGDAMSLPEVSDNSGQLAKNDI